ncbi:MAG TPA: hypothetical protein VKA68_10015, partial [bacterium]|nr:hypothetical protein [bacterium]
NVSDMQFTFDTWRINVSGSSGEVLLDFEYRFYPTFSTHFIHHGWVGYSFTPASQVQIGVTQVPFGNLKYASHNWWFVTPYYMGLEDDYDMGLKFTHQQYHVNYALAFYAQSEPNGPATLEYGGIQLANNTARYSYDILPTDEQDNSERNQVNGRVAYTLDHGETGSSEIGVSAQYGGIYNAQLEKFGSHNAVAIHLNGNYGRFNVKSEYVRFNHKAYNNQGEMMDIIQMGAYGFGTYPVAAEVSMYVLGVAYSLLVDIGPVSNITFYDDYTYTDKTKANFFDTQQNTLGFSIAAGGVFAYFDIATGKNHPWLTDSFGTGLGQGVSGTEWNTRYNINIGYYF